MRHRIFSIGYAGLTTAAFDAIAKHFDVVVDTRSTPSSRKPGFSRKALEQRLGERYKWFGGVLGGRGAGVTADGINYLLQRHRTTSTTLLFCVEAAPGECHRHNMIAARLLAKKIDVQHIFEDHVVAASDLQRHIERDTDTYMADDLSDVLAALKTPKPRSGAR